MLYKYITVKYNHKDARRLKAPVKEISINYINM